MVTMTDPRRIVELAAIISDSTALIDNYFVSNGLQPPSFDISGPSSIVIPPNEKEVAAAHLAVIGATQELRNLMLGPTAVVMGITPSDTLSLQCIYTYNIAKSFPVNEEATFESISDKCGLNVVDTKRMLRHAMTNSIFCEPRPGIVAHTAASKLIAEDPLILDFVGIGSEEQFQAAAYTVWAMKKYGFAKEPSQSGFSLSHNTSKGFYEELRDHPSRGRRWAGAMSAFASKLSLEPLLNGFDWAALGLATIVDVGGGYGPVSIGIAKRFPDLKFIVQDFHDVVTQGADEIPTEVSDRITYMRYDFLTPQPFKNGDVYFFRAIFHNWTDVYCVKILQKQIPALNKGARLIINDSCLHEPGSLPSYLEKRRRSMDLTMLSYFGSRQRSLSDWEGLLKEADERFKPKSVTLPPNDGNYILEII